MVGFVLAIIVLGVGVVYQQTRINTLEEELSSRPAMGDMIVVGKEVVVGNNSGQVCIR